MTLQNGACMHRHPLCHRRRCTRSHGQVAVEDFAGATARVKTKKWNELESELDILQAGYRFEFEQYWGYCQPPNEDDEMF